MVCDFLAQSHAYISHRCLELRLKRTYLLDLACFEIEVAAVVRSAYVASDGGRPHALGLSILLAEIRNSFPSTSKNSSLGAGHKKL